MRVTEQQTFGILANNLARSRARSLEIQQQVSTGKKVQRPSDDPSSFNHMRSTSLRWHPSSSGYGIFLSGGHDWILATTF
jgi:hypothetical protein